MLAGMGLAQTFVVVAAPCLDSGEPALIVNLRDPASALVFGLLPPSPEYRQKLNPRPYVI